MKRDPDWLLPLGSILSVVTGTLDSWCHVMDRILHLLIQFGTLVVIGLTVVYYVLKVRHALRRDREERAESSSSASCSAEAAEDRKATEDRGQRLKAKSKG